MFSYEFFESFKNLFFTADCCYHDTEDWNFPNVLNSPSAWKDSRQRYPF